MLNLTSLGLLPMKLAGPLHDGDEQQQHMLDFEDLFALGPRSLSSKMDETITSGYSSGQDSNSTIEKPSQAAIRHANRGSTRDIKRTVENLVRADVAAVNGRDFDETSPIHKNKHPEFQALMPGLKLPINLSYHQASTSEWCEALKAATILYPEYHIAITEIKTLVNQRGGSATIFANTETTGLYPGLKRTNVTIYHATLHEDCWVLSSMSTFSGLDMIT